MTLSWATVNHNTERSVKNSLTPHAPGRGYRLGQTIVCESIVASHGKSYACWIGARSLPAEALGGRKAGVAWMARYLAHDDRKPSLAAPGTPPGPPR
jgi:hypothetical protein